MAGAFTPAIASAQDGSRLVTHPTNIHTLPTRVHTLGHGETVQSVADSFNMSVNELHQLNKFRTFATGFAHLQVGDELDVPVTPLPAVNWDSEKAAPEKNSNDIQLQKLAGMASQAGSFLSNNPSGDAAASMARSKAANEATKSIENLLSQFGTTRVQLNADESFSLKNSQLDLLVPFWEQKDKLVFTQASVHRTDDRAQSNLGFGLRYFADDFMIGSNAFLDYDLSRGHTRVGIGGEFRRNFLKLGANGYLRMSDWKNSVDFDDYEERPANGWDVHAEGYLPSWPQLGGKLSYEQYYGNEVALFGKDNRKAVPYAITAGVNYTPFPLMTLSGEHRKGKSGDNDLRLGVQLNYQLGIPWSHQINPSAVAELRSLAGSRYDLVERNNNIVLEYRKNDVIWLRATNLVTGYAGQQKSLDISVNSKYGLERIDWSAAKLLAAGGKVIANSASDYSVVLPDYQPDLQGDNTYIISIVAVDKKGNSSKKLEVQVTVTEAAIHLANSSLTPTDALLPADGKTLHTLTLQVRDNQGKPVDIKEDEISLKKETRLRGSGGAQISTFKRQGLGEYVAKVTAGTVPESLTITASARNTLFPSAQITLVADSKTANIDSLIPLTTNVIADGKAQHQIKAVLIDAQGNRVPGQSVSFTANNTAKVQAEGISDSSGEIILPVTSERAGKITVTAQINGHKPYETVLTFIPDSLTSQITKSNLTITPDISVADGQTSKIVTALVTDIKGNVVPDIEVEFTASNGAILTNSSSKTDERGLATTSVISSVAGVSIIAATVNNQHTENPTTFTANLSTAKVVEINAAAGPYVADGQSAVTFTALIKDKNGNALKDVAVNWRSNKDNKWVKFGNVDTKTNAQGIATTTMTSKLADTVVVTASIPDAHPLDKSVTFEADSLTAQITQSNLTITPDISVADGRTPKTVTAIVTDDNGNLVPGVDVKFAASNGATLVNSSRKTDVNGRATISVTSTVAGESRITATIKQKDTNRQTTFTPNSATAKVTEVKAISGSNIADGKSPVLFSAEVRDKNNNILPGAIVNWSHDKDSSLVKISKTQSETDHNGIAKTEITSTRAHDVIVTASSGLSKMSASAVSFSANKQAGIITGLSTNRQQIIADEKDSAELNAKVEDSYGNPLSGVEVKWAADNDATVTPTSITDKNGVAKVTVKTRKAAMITVKAMLNGKETPVTLSSTADQRTAEVKLAYSGIPVLVGDMNGATLTATVVDKNGNIVVGIPMSWSSSANVLSADVSQSNSQGQASVVLKGTKAGKSLVTVLLNNKQKAIKEVEFKAGPAVNANSLLSIEPQSITAGGSATVKLLLRDTWSNLVSGSKDDVEFSSNENNIVFSDQSHIGNGIYQARVSGTKEGRWILTAKTKDRSVSKTVELAVLASQSTAQLHSVTVQGAVVAKADGKDTVKVRVQVKDGNGNMALPHVAVGWQSTLGTLSMPLSYTNAQGVAEISLSSTKAGEAEVSALLGGSSKSADKKITFTAGDISSSHSTLDVYPSNITAGSGKARVTLVLKDKQGNLLKGRKNDISLSNNYAVDPLMTHLPFSEKSDGVYETIVSAKKAGKTQITTQIKSPENVQLTAGLLVDADSDSAQVYGNIIATPAAAVVGQSVNYKATLVDQFGNKVGAGVGVTWSANEGSKLAQQLTQTDSTGQTSVALTRDIAGTAKVTLVLPSLKKEAPNVVFSTEQLDESQSNVELKPSTIIAGKGSATLSVILRDKKGNLLSGQKVIGTSDNPDVTLSEAQELTNKNGHYEIKATATRAGVASLGIIANNVEFSQKKTLTVGGDTGSWLIKAIAPDQRSITAGDTSGVTYSVTVTDKYDNKLPNVVVSWRLVSGPSDSKISYVQRSRTDQNGVAQTTLKSDIAGDYVMSADLDETQIKQSATVTVKPAAIDIAMSTFNIDKTEIGAVDDKANLSVVLVDKYHNRIRGEKVIFDGASSLAGFVVSNTDDRGDGSYQATAVSSNQGKVTLTAKVGGKVIGIPRNITVIGIKPNIAFANTLEQVEYTRNYTQSQMPQIAVPPELIDAQRWSSSNNDVASVDEKTGKVTLVKSGRAIIYLTTLATSKYQPATANYVLDVQKADPKLTLGKNEITSYFDISLPQTIAAKLNNPDASSLDILYSSGDSNIATVDKKGTVSKGTHSGSTVILAKTLETDQFKATQAEIKYQSVPLNHQISAEGSGVAGDEFKVTYKATDSKTGKLISGLMPHTKIDIAGLLRDVTENASGEYVTTIQEGTLTRAMNYNIEARLNGKTVQTTTYKTVAGEADPSMSPAPRVVTEFIGDGVGSPELAWEPQDKYGNSIMGRAERYLINNMPVIYSGNSYRLTSTPTLAAGAKPVKITWTPSLRSNNNIRFKASESMMYSPASLKDISANGANFAISDGFPTVGIYDKEFVLNIDPGANPPGIHDFEEYNWYGSNGMKPINSIWKFWSVPDRDRRVITITGNHKKYKSKPLTYTFTLKHIIERVSGFATTPGPYTYEVAQDLCIKRGGTLPSRDTLLKSHVGDRSVGSAITEWGFIFKGSDTKKFWTKDRYLVGNNGSVEQVSGNKYAEVACVY